MMLLIMVFPIPRTLTLFGMLKQILMPGIIIALDIVSCQAESMLNSAAFLADLPIAFV